MSSIPDFVGEVVGWRAWTVVEPSTRHPRLRSANAANTVGIENAIWPTNRWFYATCPGGHTIDEIPHAGCMCGLYAAADLDHLFEYGYAQFSADGVTAIGEVGFAGRIIEGGQGWKAQKGRVIRLYLPLSQGKLGRKLAEAYNVPFELVEWWVADERLRLLTSVS